jgi:cell division transport system ATP-binding protein
VLSIKNVTKTFGGIAALEDVSFDVDQGEFLFICGPTGSGKTTLIRLILRDLLPDSGEIFLLGADVTKLPQKEIPKLRQKIGVIFQDFKVLPERTLRENVETALAVVGIPQAEWETRVDQVLNLVGLAHRDSFFPSQLSGGELQRASIARALVVNPKIILADEPTGNLDWDTAYSLMSLFEKVNAEGKTVIMVTHHRLIVDKLGKRVIELKEGKMVGDKGKPEREKEESKAKTKKSSNKKTKARN